MLVLTQEDIKKAITMREAIDAVETAFAQHYLQRAAIPLRTRIHCTKSDGDVLFMPAYMQDLDGVGIKIVSVFPRNAASNKPTISAIMLLNDVTTGEPLALMDATYLTALRTGAASGAATRHLANQDAARAAIFGTGAQALRQLEAILEVRNLVEVMVFDIDPGRVGSFIDTCAKELSRFTFSLKQAADPDEAVRAADIIVTATTSRKPVFHGHDIKNGVHINGIGSYTPEMQELDALTVSRADKLVVDAYDASLKEAGDLIIPLEKGLITTSDIYCEIGKITSGQAPGRENKEEITLFKSVGIAAQDIAVAKIIYDHALAKGLGQQISLS